MLERLDKLEEFYFQSSIDSYQLMKRNATFYKIERSLSIEKQKDLILKYYLLLIIIILSACQSSISNKTVNSEKLTGGNWGSAAKLTNKDGEVTEIVRVNKRISADNGYITFTFNKEMQRLPTEIISYSITPKLSCEWYWSDPINLDCFLMEGAEFKPATEYLLEIKSGLFGKDGKEIKPYSIKFETERPTIKLLKVNWLKPTQPEINIDFNYGIEPRSMTNNFFLVNESGMKIPLKAYVKENNNGYFAIESWRKDSRWVLRAEQQLEPNTTYSLFLERGVVSPFGKLVSSNGIISNREGKIKSFGKFEYLGYQCLQNSNCNPNQEIAIKFSSEISTEQVKNCKSSLERQGLKVVSYFNYPDRIIVVPNFANVTKRLDCLENITDIFGRKLSEDTKISISIKDFEPFQENSFGNEVLTYQDSLSLEHRTINYDSIFVVIEEVDFEKVKPDKIYKERKIILENTKNKVQVTNLLPDGIAINNSIQGRVVNEKKRWRDQKFFIQKAKYNIVLQHHKDNALIFISDIYTNKPIPDQEFTVEYKDEKGIDLTTVGEISAKTDAKGFALISKLPLPKGYYRDRNWLFKFPSGDKISINAGHKIVSKKNTYSREANTYDASKVFWGITNKPLYRPGDTVHYSGFLRKISGGIIKPTELPKDPVVYVFANHMECYSNSQCETFYIDKSVKQDEFGVIKGHFKIPKQIKDGLYSISLDSSEFDNDILNEVYFEVANFKSQKIKLSVQSDVKGTLTSKKVKIISKAEYYSGGQYGGVNAEVAVSLEKAEFAQQRGDNSDFMFEPNDTLDPDDFSDTYYYDVGKLDENGKVSSDIVLPNTSIKYGYLKFQSSIVTDEGDKVLSRLESIPFSRKMYYVGIKKLNWWLKTDVTTTLNSQVVDLKGVVKNNIKVKYYIQRITNPWSDYENRNQEPLHEIKCEKLLSSDTSNEHHCNFKQKKTGAFRLFAEITYADGSSQKSSSMHYFTNDSNDESAPLIIRSPSKILDIGDVGKVTLSHGLKGASALIVIHRANIIDYWWQPLNDGVNDIKFEIKKEYSPGFDLSVYVNYGNLDELKNTHSPNYAQVITERIRVKKRNKPPIVEIDSVPNKSSPGETIAISLTNKNKLSSSVVLALIDESIINQIENKDYYQVNQSSLGTSNLTWSNPEMYELSSKLYSSRQFQNMFESEGEKIIVTGSRLARVDIALSDTQGSVSDILRSSTFNSFGNFRGEKNQFKTIGNITANFANIRSFFKDSAYWNNQILVKGGSTKTIEIKLPDNLTTWKIIAISTIKSGQIFVDEKQLTTSKSLEVHSEVPSQLTIGDQFKFQAEVISKSKKIDSISFASAAQSLPDRMLLSEVSKKFHNVKVYHRNKLSMDVIASTDNQLQVLSVATADSISDALLQVTPVYSKKIIQKVSYYSQLPEDDKVIVDIPKHSISNKGKLSFELSGSALSNLQGTFNYMQTYPHQCWEQKLSRAVVAQINLDAGVNSKIIKDLLKAQIQDAIDSVYSFQSLNGGVSFFGKSEDSVSPFLSAYSYKMIQLLASKGIKFPESSIASLKRYLVTLFDSRDSKMTVELAAVVVNALAMDKVNHKIIKQYLPSLLEVYSGLDVFSQSQILEVVARYPEFYLYNQGLFQSIISNSRYTEKKRIFVSSKSLPWYFHNYDAKTYCATISSLVANKTDKKVIYQFINGLLDLRRKQKGDFGNTMSNAYCSVAINDYVSRYENINVQSEYKLLFGERSVILDKRQKEISSEISLEEPIEVSIKAIKSGTGYLKTTLQYMLDGMKPNAVANGFSIRRNYFIKENNRWVLATSNNIKQGSYVKVQLKIVNPLIRRMVAITDMLPGTFFALDERLANSAPSQLFEELNNDYYFNEKQFTARNVKFYADILPAGNHTVEYLVKVTHQGNFSALSAKIEDMYDDDIYATSIPSTVVVH